MEKLKELRKGNQMKEFQNIIGNVLRVRKKIFVAREIRDPETPEEIVYEPDRIRRLILDKYGKLYGSDHEKFYFEIGNIEPTTSKDICRAAELVSVDKELGIDCIPDYNDPECALGLVEQQLFCVFGIRSLYILHFLFLDQSIYLIEGL